MLCTGTPIIDIPINSIFPGQIMEQAGLCFLCFAFLLLLSCGESSEEKGNGASAYAVHWDPDHTYSEQNGFDVSAYAVHWDPDYPHSEQNGFGASAYAVHWDPDHPHSEQNGFGVGAYVVHWDPDHRHSASAVPEAVAKHHQIKVQTGMLFLKKNLHVGTVLPEGTKFARAGAPKPVDFISTLLESKNLPSILARFKIPHGSMKAKQVADTLESCGKLVEMEEPHMCFTSHEAMTRFSTKALGLSGARSAITRIHGHETPNSMYTIAQIAQLSNNVVPCHPMDFPYEVFYCHRPKEVQALRVQLKGLKDGMPRVTATAMYHMNTSDWDEQYFELLGGERGESICHYMPTNYIMFY
ncbi:BURP domain-containing protein 4 isoform X2 [Triticum aestivum]|nr:BURP domain-containing protein 4-like isoform X2 [Triticum aestivum]